MMVLRLPLEKTPQIPKEKTGVIIMELRIRKVKMVSIGVNPHNIPNRIRKDMMKAIPKEVIWDLT